MFLFIKERDESAGTAIVEAIAIGEPPDFVIKTDTSAELDPSMLAIVIEFIFKTLFAAQASISVVRVVSKVAWTLLPKIDVTFTIFGAAIMYSFYPKTIAIAILFPVVIPAVSKLKTPDPLVTSACPLVPSAVGNVKLKFDPKVVVFKAT